jgi:stage II sporulation protein D
VSVAFSQSTDVRIGLFNGRTPHEIQITGYSGLRISGRIAHGTVTVVPHGPLVFARDSAGGFWQDNVLTIASRSGRWIDLKADHQWKKRTVGILEIRLRNGGMQVINRLPEETYVLGVVNGELGSLHFNAESMKAQIVASRSFVLASRGRHLVEGFDFCDGPHCQVFTGTAEINQAYKEAVEETRGLYLTFAGRPIPGYFHDNCGGRTAAVQDVWGAPAAPYLQSVEDLYCTTASRAHWTYRIKRELLGRCLRTAGWIHGSDALDSLRVAVFDRSGRADQIAIEGNRTFWVPASEFRQALVRAMKTEVLPSTKFLIERDHGDFIFEGRGWGHGVGLCQSGAIAMANAGKNYHEILDHYYPGTRLERLPEAEYAQQALFETQALR